MSSDDTLEHAFHDLGVPLFSDTGARRTISWSALSVTWSIEFGNTYDNTVIGERMAAAMQVIAADLAARDPALIPTHVRVLVEVADSIAEATLDRPIADGDGSTLRVTLPVLFEPSVDAFNDAARRAIQVMAVCAGETTVHDQATLLEIFEDALKEGITGAVVFGTVYDIAYSAFITRDLFNSVPRLSMEPLPQGASASPRTGDALGLPALPAPDLVTTRTRWLFAAGMTIWCGSCLSRCLR
jgi:hypothetical protein